MNEPDPGVPEPDGPPVEATPAAGSTSIAAEPPPSPALRPYDLPTARQVVISGLQLAASANGELRRGSVYVGLLMLGLLGPTLVFGLAIAARFSLTDVDLVSVLRTNSALSGPVIALIFLFYGGIAGVIAVTIDGQLIAVSLLAARAGDRNLTLRDATTRARQVFWRLVRGSLIVGLATSIFQEVIRALFGDLGGQHQAVTIVALLASTIVFAPFGYLATGVVLGDVGAIESLRRSIRLARARPWTALVVALFTLLTSAIQLFALSAGLELLVDVGQFFNIGLGAGGIALVALVVSLLAFVVAVGSLLFTVSAIVVAPQVAAFLGLTFYAGGLDRARDPGVATFRWITRPMRILMLVMGLGSLAGVYSLGSAGAPRADLLVPVLESVAGTHSISLTGPDSRIADPAGDETGLSVPNADIVSAQYAYVPIVPAWFATDVFPCGRQDVACSLDGSPLDAYDSGAYLFAVQVAAPIGVAQNGDAAEWGVELALDGYDPAPVDAMSYPLASEVLVSRIEPGGRSMHFFGWDVGSYTEYRTYARSRWVGHWLLMLVPIRDDIQTAPLAWDAFMHYSVGGPSAGTGSDALRESGTAALETFGIPALLDFPGSTASERPTPAP